ncbi:OmpA family protein [Photobacterium aquimaris]|uniref:Photosystem I P700 chlorophyll a apoprotein A2 n=1 Tax=Photobacterium aquimaris TaxID=512643 RepID=A0A1Y6L0V6_9GAMM|nr:OmpA family protein [Photobacterium aquimaris]SMY18041.1 Photosystem I P700 chlorophyll a apoprotein A2 [Photobacterium aquimaris]
MKVILFLLLGCAFLSGCVSDNAIYADYGKWACYKEQPKVQSLFWPSVINFDFNQSNIAESEEIKLSQAVKVLKEYSSFNLAVIGATDPEGTPEYNDALSLRRATAVSQYLQRQGIARSRLVLIGTGENELFINTDDQKKNRANRRTQLILLDAKHNPVDIYFNKLALPSEPLIMNKVNSL